MVEYCAAKYVERQRDLLYRMYITDAIKARYDLNVRYYDLAFPDLQQEETEEEAERKAEEIKNRIKNGVNRLGSNEDIEV